MDHDGRTGKEDRLARRIAWTGLAASPGLKSTTTTIFPFCATIPTTISCTPCHRLGDDDDSSPTRRSGEPHPAERIRGPPRLGRKTANPPRPNP